MASAPPASWRRIASRFDRVLPLGLTALGLLSPTPGLWYRWLVILFVVLCGGIFMGAAAAQVLSDRVGRRIQGPRRGIPKMPEEAFDTVVAMYVIATLGAWPASMVAAGTPTGLVWTLEEAGGSWALVLLQFGLGLVLVDAWTWWKHYLLHTRWLFPFHAGHHRYRDPSAFGGFAVGPVETVLTFWPLLLVCWPAAVHFAPVYFGLIVGFVALNFYLHCGVTIPWMERWLPRLGLNSSAWHNVHHAKVNAHYGEVSFLWDRLMGTALDEDPRRTALEPAEA